VYGPDDTLHLACDRGPHFETFAKNLKTATNEWPEAGQPDARDRKREPGPDSFVAKVAPDHKRIEWVVRIKHARVNALVRPGGKLAWTAYGRTGPIVGVDQHRLVADSAVTAIRVAENGKLVLTGWSDGGNTVLGQQPYDLRLAAKCGGFCSETWGTTGGLTVRIAHSIHIDPDTMEVSDFNRYIGYIPTSGVPTLINIYDSHPLPNGSGWTGFVESQDARLTPWFIEHRTDKHALAKGGPFFTLFKPGFSAPRMATILPKVAQFAELADATEREGDGSLEHFSRRF